MHQQRNDHLSNFIAILANAIILRGKLLKMFEPQCDPVHFKALPAARLIFIFQFFINMLLLSKDNVELRELTALTTSLY